jgi:fucose permease
MQNKKSIIILVNLVFFMVGLIIAMTGALLPEIIRDFNISYTAAAILPLAYFISFGIFAIPAGILIEKFSYKKVLLSAFLLGTLGVIIFAYFKNYYSCIIALFIIGCSMATAQVVVFPLLREAVGAQKLAFHSTFNQFLYGAGALVSPFLYSMIVTGISNKSDSFPYNLLRYISADSYAWTTVYWVFFIFFVSITILIFNLKFPEVHLSEDEKIGDSSSFKELFSNKYVYLFFFALFSYAACEQGNGNWLTQFLSNFHSINPQTTGAKVLSGYWLLLTLGCGLGMILLKFFESRKILFGFTIAAIISLFLAAFGSSSLSISGFLLLGFSHSVMWPLILAMAMNSVKKHHGSLSGILFAASTGGAFGSLMLGRIGDLVDLRWGLFSLIICYIMVASVFFWSKSSYNQHNN